MSIGGNGRINSRRIRRDQPTPVPATGGSSPNGRYTSSMTTILNGGQPVTTEARLNAATVRADNEAANSGVIEIDLGANISLSGALMAIDLHSG
jgi:hypothetical protein